MKYCRKAGDGGEVEGGRGVLSYQLFLSVVKIKIKKEKL
jgi:hypothetical protein